MERSLGDISPHPGNRRDRRRQERSKPRDLVEFDSIHDKYYIDDQTLSTLMNKSTFSALNTGNWLINIISSLGHRFGIGSRLIAPLIYSEDPFLVRVWDTNRAFSNAIARTGAKHPELPQISDIKQEDTLTVSIEGTSLADIETMPLPFLDNDFKRINRFLKRDLLRKLSISQTRARELFLLVPIQKIVQAGEFKDLIQLDAPSRRSVSYLDYYLPFFMEPYLDSKQELDFMSSMFWVDNLVIQSMGAFIPARLGLSPSSVEKRYRQKELTAPGDSRIFWNTLNAILIPETREAYRTGFLPPRLEAYRHFDLVIDRNAAKLLEDYYFKKGSSVELLDTGQIMDNLEKYKRNLRRDILGASEKYIVQLIDHPMISEVLITSQNRNVLMFILLFKDDNTHLTLEVNGGNRLYGIPPQLFREYPHIEDTLVSDVMVKLLENFRIKYPQIETVEKPKLPQAQIIPRVEPKQEPDFKKLVEIDLEEAPVEKISKKRIKSGVAVEPEVPRPVLREKPRYRVRYTRAEVTSYLGKKYREEDLERMLAAIQRLERGEKPLKALQGDEAYSLRVGDWRVILDSVGGNNLTIRTIGWRDVVYSRT